MPFISAPPGTSGGGGGSGTVTNVSSPDTSIVVTNPTTTPALQLATLDVIATNELAAANVPLNGKKITGLGAATLATDAASLANTLDQFAAPAANVPFNAKKITGLANGAAAQDAAAFGQIPAALPPSGAAGGDLTGTYPNPTVANAKISVAKLTTGVTLDAIAAANATAAAVAMNAQKITGLAAGTAAGDGLRYEQQALRRTSTTNAPGATPSMNADNFDSFVFTGLAAAITSMTTNLSGTPVAGQTLWVALTDNGTGRAITWGASFEASTVALPTTTIANARLDVGFVWNVATSKWRCVATA